MLLAIGSRDPITLAQVDALRAAGLVDELAAPDGAAPARPAPGARGAAGAARRRRRRRSIRGAAGARFARTVVASCSAPDGRTLFGCGGETADAILGELGVGVLQVEGELLPGVPVSRMVVNGRDHAPCHQIRWLRRARHAVVGGGGCRRRQSRNAEDERPDKSRRRAGPPAPRHRPALAERIYHLLYSRISNGDYPANRKLPPEKTLAEEFGVSRPVVRAALERLREQGLVHSRQGAGSFVREARTAPLGFARVETIADIQRCYEFRICIETTSAALAAARRNQAALEEIGTALSLMDAATDLLTHREDADYAFHLAVARAANNQYFEASMRALREHIYVG